MSSLDDLRHALDAGAGRAEPIGPTTWNDGVRAKVRTMRRRRRAGGAAAVAAVTAVVAGLALIPSGPGGPEGPQPAAGVMPPSTMTSLGYTYTWTESIDAEDGLASYDVDGDAGPLLVTWATDGSDQRVRVSADWGWPGTYRNPDFGDFVLVPAGGTGTISARATDGEAGLAVYELSSAARGLTQDGFTFRDSIAGGTLAGAAFNEPGDSTVELTVTPTTGRIAVVYFCDGVARAVRTRVESDGFMSSGGGCDENGHDVAGGSRYSTRWEAGRELTLTLSATEGVEDDRGAPVTDADLRLGLGVYDLSDGIGAGPTAGPAEVIEAAGHRWRLEEVARSNEGERRVTTTVGGDDVTRWVVALAGGGRRDQVVLLSDGRPGTRFTGGGSSVGIGVVTGRSTVGVQSRGTPAPDLVMAVAVYVQDD